MFSWISRLFLSPDKPKHEAAEAMLGQISFTRRAETYKDRGNAHLAKGELAAALTCYRQAVGINSGYAEGHNNLGVVLLQQGMLDDAVASFKEALLLKPGLAQPHINLGNAYKSQGRSDEALACFNKALSLDSTLPDVHNNMGILLQERGQLDDALACFRTAIALKPDLAQAHCNIGILAADKGQLAEAYAHYRNALALKPDYADAMSNLLLTTQYDPQYSPSEIYAEHLRFGERFERPFRSMWPKHSNSRDTNRRLRVGFVSGDLRAHPVGYFIENVLAYLDKRTLDITLYPTSPKTDDLSQRLQNLGISWHPLAGLSDDDAAQRIINERIDILVDLSGHTEDNRLPVFARKPAPVQVSWLYFSTTGLQSMDYVLCDRYVLPPEEEAYFTETPWRLPDSYLCFTPPKDNIPVGELPALRNGYVTFGCFNNLIKMDDAVVRCWAKILRTIPNSSLILKSRQLSSSSIRLATMERFGKHGIDSDRLILEGPSPRTQYLACYSRVDIALDPFPFPGGTTTVEALWMGIPVLTRRGNRFISHAGECILSNAGLPEWIANDDNEYIAKAHVFAADHQRLAELRSSLRGRLIFSPLCDAPRFAHNLDMAFREMWSVYCSSH